MKAYLTLVNKEKTTKPVSVELLRFLTWFCNTKVPMSQLDDPTFWPILDPKIKLPSYKEFRYDLMSALLLQLTSTINEILCEAASICLIADGWTCSVTRREFLGLATLVTNADFSKRIILIGLTELLSGHSALETKKAIELIVNEYTFPKN